MSELSVVDLAMRWSLLPIHSFNVRCVNKTINASINWLQETGAERERERRKDRLRQRERYTERGRGSFRFSAGSCLVRSFRRLVCVRLSFSKFRCGLRIGCCQGSTVLRSARSPFVKCEARIRCLFREYLIRTVVSKHAVPHTDTTLVCLVHSIWFHSHDAKRWLSLVGTLVEVKSLKQTVSLRLKTHG